MTPDELINQLTDSEPEARSCRAAVFRSNGDKLQVLLACNTGMGEWSLPGDDQQLHETTKQAAERGLFEETGIRTTVDFLLNENTQFIPRAIFYAAVESAAEPAEADQARWVDVDMLNECDPPLDSEDIKVIEAALKKVHNPDAIVAEAVEALSEKLLILGIPQPSEESIAALRAMRALDGVTEAIILSQEPSLTDEQIRKKAWEVIAEERGVNRDLIESIKKLRENDPDDPRDYLSHLKSSGQLATFHISRNGQQGVHGRLSTIEDYYLVYSNDKPGNDTGGNDHDHLRQTRTFEGYLVPTGDDWTPILELEPIKEPHGWNSPGELEAKTYGKTHPTQEAAAYELYIFNRQNRK